MMGFKNGFVWGTATAAYQVEGAAYEDGKGLNVWDIFCKEEGHIFEGHTGDVACDEYHRYKEDVMLMKQMGIQAYRFSVSWARVMPDGTGAVNEKGLAYYDRLVDELLANGIEPYMTLYHWDLPYELHRRGGWMNPDAPEWFYQYAKVIGARFSDRVTHFFTINEPQCIVGLGYQTGIHAPGLKVGPYDYFRIWHNVLRAHGRAVQALRETAVQPVKIGMAPCGAMCYPASDSPEDIEAARKRMFSVPGNTLDDCTWDVAFWCDPVFFGKYPDDIMEKFGKYIPEFTEEDRRLITQPLDFYGQNLYNGMMIRDDGNGNPERVTRYPGFPKTAIQWPVTPESLYWAPKFLYERYKLPVLITENGMSAHDVVSLDGKVHDSNRIDFIHRYLRELRRAADDGVDIDGYFIWSVLDNFEWYRGYSERFGLVYVDYLTQKRIIKDSGWDYKEIIQSNGEHL